MNKKKMNKLKKIMSILLIISITIMNVFTMTLTTHADTSIYPIQIINSSNGETSFMIMSDGTVKAWGYNNYGELGIGNTTQQNSPVTVPGLTGVKQLSAGHYHTVALMNDGTVKAWGYNSSGQLGIGNTTQQNSPVTVPGLTGVTQLSVGFGFTVALMNDGTVKAWGDNTYGQLGIGNTTQQNSPITVSSLTGVKQLSAGTNYTVALMNDGTVKAWGYNNTGQLGIGNTTEQSSPVTVPGLTAVAQLSTGNSFPYCGYGFTVALMNDGTVKSWGDNAYGQLGIGNTTQQNSPVTVSGLTGVKQLGAGCDYAVALMNDGTVKAWGYNRYGVLGTGDKIDHYSPVNIPGLTGVAQLSAGHNHASALMNDGTVKAWGDNTWGQLGIGNTTELYSPAMMPSLVGVKQLSAGFGFTVALMNDGTVKAWGDNSSGQLGIGNTSKQQWFAVTVPGLTGVVQLSAGYNYAVALMNDGTVKAWGSNGYGQLGIGNTIQEISPVTVPGLTGVKQLSAGQYHTVALMNDGTVKAWGSNGSAQLGTGNTAQQNSPVTVPGLTGVKQLSAGGAFTVALMNDGTVKAWGYNGYGQLGIGNTTIQYMNVVVPGLTGVKQLSAGVDHTVALMNDGTVKAWGYNGYGQLGIGNTTQQNSPVTVPGLTGVKQLSAGYYHTVALMNDGTVKAWGDNGYGRLGIGKTTQQNSPVIVPGLTGVTQISVAYDFTDALMNDGTVTVWGNNCNGQLGLINLLRIFTVNIRNIPPKINLTQNLTVPTNGNVTVTATITDFSGLNIYTSKWASGSQVASYFTTGGTVFNGTFQASTSGIYTVYAKDNTGLETVQTINVDTVAPTLALSLAKTSPTNQPVVINISSSDTGSGVATTKWLAGTKTIADFASAGTIVSGSSFSVTANGVYTVYAKDNVGNGIVKTITVSNYEVTPPTVTLSTPGTWTNQNVPITATISDASGIAVQKYASGSQAVSYFASAGTTFTGSSFTVSANGVYTVYAKDNAGNEIVQTITVSYYDVTPPTVTLSTPGTWINQNVPITATISDASGIAVQKYASGNQAVSYFASAGTTFTGTSISVSANNVYTVYAKDKAGNETVNTITISKYDPTLPVLSLSLANSSPTNQPVVINVTASDAGSGVATTKWLAGTKTITDFASAGTIVSGSSFSVTANGVYTVYIKDNAGNEIVKTITVSNYDPNPPTVTLSTPGTPTNQNVPITATISDASGIAVQKYASGNQAASYFASAGTTFTGSLFTVNANGVYTVYAKDSVGNEIVKTITVSNYDVTPPTVTLSTTGTWTNQSVPITAIISDDASGIAVQKYASGNQAASYFASAGTAFTGSSFTVNVSGAYTVYAKDKAGNETVNTIEVAPDLVFYVHAKGEASDIWHKCGSPWSDGNIVDGIKIQLVNAQPGLRVKYNGYVAGTGWQEAWSYDGAVCGTLGTPLQGVQVKLEGDSGYSIKYYLGCKDSDRETGFCLDGTTSGYSAIDEGNTEALIGEECYCFSAVLINKNEFHKEYIDKDTTWSSGTHVIDGELIINQGVTLTINGSANVVFQRYKYRVNGIQVYGNLNIGTSAQQIQFSYQDDGGTLSEEQYLFEGIQVESTGIMKATNAIFKFNDHGNYIRNYGITTLDSCKFDFLNYSDIYVFSEGDSSITNCTFNNSTYNYSWAIEMGTIAGKVGTISNCVFTNIGHAAILMEHINGTVKILNNTFSNNVQAISLSSSTTDSGLIDISGNTIDGGTEGIYLDWVQSQYLNLSVTSNNIRNCSSYGIYVGQYMGVLTCQKNIISGVDAGRQNNGGPIVVYTTNLGTNFARVMSAVNPMDSTLKNTLSGNSFDAVILQGAITEDSKLPRGYYHYIMDYYTIAENKTLMIEDGTITHLRGGLEVYGKLLAEGKDSDTGKIVFTNVNNANYKIDFKTSTDTYKNNEDNSFDWISIEKSGTLQAVNAIIMNGYTDILNQGVTLLINSTISNGDSGIYSYPLDGVAYTPELTVINCKVKDNSIYGIHCESTNATIINSVIQNNFFGIDLDHCSKYVIGENCFQKNTDAVDAIPSKVGDTVNLEYNYWDSLNGPKISDNRGCWGGSGQYVYIDNGLADCNYYYTAPPDPYDIKDINEYLHNIELRDQKWFGQQGVSVATGNYCKTFDDMDNCFPAFEFGFSHTYNSKDDTASILGKGWRFSFQGEISDYKSSTGQTMKKVVLPSGETQTYTVNTDGTFKANDSRNILTKLDDTYTLTNKEQMQYIFTSGKLSSIKDRNGNSINVTYDNDKIQNITDGTGKVFKFTYDSAGYLDKITEYFGTAAGRILDFDCTNNKLSTVKDGAGNVTNYYYDANGLLQTIKDGDGVTLANINYVADGTTFKVHDVTDSYNNKLTYVYDSFINRTMVTDSNGSTTEYWCDDYGYQTSIIYPDRTTKVTSYYLDPTTNANNFGEEKSVTDIYGNTTSYERDERGNITKITNPDNSTKSMEYDDKNNLTKQIDERKNITYMVYYPDKINLNYKIQPLNGTDSLETCLADHTKAAITTYEYYPKEDLSYKVKGLLKSETDPMNNTVSYIYDKTNGNKLDVTDKLGKHTTYTYDGYNHMKTMTTPDLIVTSYVYDINGNLERSTVEGKKDGLNNGKSTTRTVYDNKGQKKKEITPNLYSESSDNILAHTYADNVGTRYEYNANGTVYTITDAMNNTTTYYYDYYGNIKKEVKPNGAVYNYQYDCHNRPIKTTFKEKESSTNEITIEEFSYNINLPSTYTSNKKLDKEHKLYIDGTNYLLTVSTFDYADRLVSLQNPDGTQKSITYYPNGLKASEKDEASSITYYKYDNLNRLISKWVPIDNSTATTLYTFTGYRYDNNGNERAEWTGKDPVGRDRSVLETDSNIVKVNYDYYPDDKLNVKSDNEGRKTEYEYDDDRALTKETVHMDSAGETQVTVYRNNYLEKPYEKLVKVSKKDIYGNSLDDSSVSNIFTKYDYDYNGNLVTESDYGIINGSDVTAQTPILNSISYTYDNVNRQTGVIKQAKDVTGSNTTISTSQNYTWEGKIFESVDGNGKKTTNYYDARGRLVEVDDAKGKMTTYTYDYAGKVLSKSTPKDWQDYKAVINAVTACYNSTPGSSKWNAVYDINKDGIIDMYDIILVSNDAPNKTSYEYDSMGRVIREIKSVRDASTLQWHNTTLKAYKYDSRGNVIKELDALGYSSGTGIATADIINSGYGTEYKYNLANKKTEVLLPESKKNGQSYTYKYEYDALGRVKKETNEKKAAFTYAYNNSGLVLEKDLIKVDGKAIVPLEINTYDLTDNLTTKVDGNGNKTIFEYNELGTLRKSTTPSDATVPSNITQYQYDIYGHMVLSQDSVGKSVYDLYDNAGRKIYEKVSKTDGTQAIETSYKNDGNGNVVSYIDGNNKETITAYDELNRPISKSINVDYVGGATKKITTSTEYDGDGNVTKETDWQGNTIKSTYDVFGRLVEKRDATDKLIEKLTYYENGTQKESFDAKNNGISYEYDKNNRLTKTTKGTTNQSSTAVPQVTQQIYDGLGNVIQKIDGRDNVTHYTYDELNRVLTVLNPLQETTSYTYDNNGNMLTKTDGGGNITTYHYNCINKLDTESWSATTKSVIDSVLNKNVDLSTKALSEKFTYYADGNLATMIDKLGNTTTYTYDVHNRELTEAVGDISYSYSYDNNDNLLTSKDSTGTTIRKYDSLNRVTSKTVPNAGTTTYLYDSTDGLADGYHAEISTDPKGFKTTKVYDKNDRLYQVIENGKTTTYSYWDNGSTSQVLYPNGTKEAYTYNFVNSLEQLTNYKADGTVLESFNYNYDGAGNISKKTDGKGDTSYTYDGLNRVSTIAETVNGRNTEYSYDKAGNRSTATVTSKGTDITGKVTTSIAVTNYYYDANNKLRYSSQLDSSNKTEDIYTYDDNGNELTVTENTYNSSNVLQTSKVTTNQYDKLNQLTETVTQDGTDVKNAYNAEGLRVQKNVNGTVSNFMYEADKLVLEFDSSGNVTGRNIYGTNLISRTAGGQKAYYFYNGHADVTDLVNEAGEVIGTYYYDAFGTPVQNSSSLSNQFLYSGYQYDKETGMYYLNARMYNPVTARFLQEDTYSGDINDPLTLNLYTYCANNPIIYKDPTGHWFGLDDLVASVAGAVVGVAGQYVGDVINNVEQGKSFCDALTPTSSWETYVGAAVGGAAAGETMLYTGNPILAGMAYGGASTVVSQGLEKLTGDKDRSWGEIVTNTAGNTIGGGIGGATLMLTGNPILTGVTAGGSSTATSELLQKAFGINDRSYSDILSDTTKSAINGGITGGILGIPGKVFNTSGEVNKAGNEVEISKFQTTKGAAEPAYTSFRDLMSPDEVARYDKHWTGVAERISNEALDNQINFIKNGGITKPGGGAYKPAKISAAVDMNTGDISYGYNGANKFNPSRNTLKPELQSLIDNTKSLAANDLSNPYAARNSYELWSVDNCAEVYATNNALINGANIDNIFLNTKYFNNGAYAEPCANCKITFKGFSMPNK